MPNSCTIWTHPQADQINSAIRSKNLTQAQIAEKYSCPCGCGHTLSVFSVQRHASECLNEYVVHLRTQIRKKTALLKKLQKSLDPDVLVKVHQFSKILNDMHAALDGKLHPKNSEPLTSNIKF